MGKRDSATSVPPTVPTAPSANAPKSRPVSRTTRRKSEPNSSSGTASGSRKPVTTAYVGEAVGSTPRLDNASAARVVTSGPDKAAPSFVVFSALHTARACQG